MFDRRNAPWGKGFGSSKSRRSRRIVNAAASQAIYPICLSEPLERRVLLSGLTTITSFTPFDLGAYPTSTLVADGAGNLYGTASSAGSDNDGTVFEWVQATNTVSVVATFNGADGANPASGVVFDGSGNLFGTTHSGGANGYGNVYEIIAGTNTITPLASFNSANGAYPYGGVVLDGAGDVFGTAFSLGPHSDGAVFEILKGSGTITAIASFNGLNGSGPYATLTMDGQGDLYGTTVYGGVNNVGTVFEIASGTNTIQTIASFNSISNGQNPYGGVLLDGSGDIFGTTLNGGGEGVGVVYEIQSGTKTITPLASFNGMNGQNPYDTLIMDGAGNLYGTAAMGGSPSPGVVFELVNGTNSITLLASVNSAGAAYPLGGLLMDTSGNLYGTTEIGGNSGFGSGNGSGTIFELAQGSSSITILSDFTGVPAYDSYGGVVPDGNGNLYGLTEYGGAANNGTLYEVATGTNAISILFSFNPNDDNGTQPIAGLTVDSHGNLYGVTQFDGANGYGAVFEFDPVTNSMMTVASFNDTDGSDPICNIAIDGSGDIFGTANSGGAAGQGTAWEIVSGSNTITPLVSFNDSDLIQGSSPEGNVALDSGGNLYGTTEFGGANDEGTVFEIASGSNAVTTLGTFNATTNGGYPRGGVSMDGNGNLFGTTFLGGANDEGTVFEVAEGSNTISTVANFNSLTDGSYGYGTVTIDAAGNLFGVTLEGGNNDAGIVFEVANGTNTITPLASFSNSINGNGVLGALTMDGNGDLFGTTYQSGPANEGTVFELPGAATVAPAITSFAVNGGAIQRSMVTQAALVFNQPVTLATGAISIVQRASGGGTPTPITFTLTSTDNTTWNLTFPGYTGGSLPDGIFDLTVTAADVTSISAPTLSMTGGNQTFSFDRLFGDIDGNGIVNNADYFQFKKSFGQLAGGSTYNAAFDYDANGVINNADYFQFKKRFGQQIVIAAESQLSSDAALLANSDFSSYKNKTPAILL